MAIGVGVRDITLPNVDRRMILGGILAAIAAFGVLQMTKPPERLPVLVAGSDLAAGRPLGEMDIDVRYVESDTGLVAGDSVGDLADWSLRVPLAEGEPLVTSLMQPPELVISPNVIALSLPAENAVLGRLVAGDHVDIYLTYTGGFEVESSTGLLASRVYFSLRSTIVLRTNLHPQCTPEPSTSYGSRRDDPSGHCALGSRVGARACPTRKRDCLPTSGTEGISTVRYREQGL